MGRHVHKGISKRSRHLRLALLSACCIGGWASVAAAADAADETTTVDSSDIIVTGGRAIVGTKTDTPITQIPQSISVITSQEFLDRASVNFQDVFRYSAGVASELNGVDARGDFFAARGFPVEQYLDGLNRMPSFVYGARLEIFTLERAEVLRGPSSTLYGGGGAGGILNAISKRPKEEFGGEVGVTIGTDARKEFRFDVTGGLTNGVSARLVALVRDGHMQQKSQDDKRVLINPSITFKPGENTDITLIGLYQKDNNGTQTYLPTSKTVDATDSSVEIPFNFFLGEPGYNHMDTKYASGSLLITHRFGENITFNSRSRYFRQTVDYAEVYGYYTYDDGPAKQVATRYYYDLDEKYRGFNTDNNLAIRFTTGAFQHQVLIGADYTRFRQNRSEGYGAAPGLNLYNPVYGVPFASTQFVDILSKSTQFGIYAQDQIRAWDRVSIVLGLRHDSTTASSTTPASYTKLPSNKAWTYRVGVVGDLTKTISPYFSYAESFLPVVSTNIAGTPKPRTGRQYEGGVKWAPLRGALFTVSVFDIKEDNYVVADPDNIQNFLQTGKVGSKGVELEGTVRMPDNFELTASYSYNKAKILSDTTPARVGARIENLPRNSASAWGAKTFFLADDLKVKVGAGVRYTGSKIDYNQVYFTDPVTLVDSMVEVDYRGWNLSVNASNLFNTRVYTNCAYQPFFGEGYCYLGKDRTVMASLRRSF